MPLDSPVQQITRKDRYTLLNWSAILRGILGAVVLVAIIASLTFLPAPHSLKSFLEWIHGLGRWGPLVFVFIYVVACLVFLPGSALTVAGGFLFGFAWGAITASVGATLGATAAFLIGRIVVRNWIEYRLTAHPRFRAIDRAVGQQGFKIVLLVRLCSLLPYDLMSYLFGLTDVSLRRYVVATWLGRLPETLAWAYIGSTAKNLGDVLAGKVELGMGRTIFFGLGVAAMIAVTVVLANIARKALHEAVSESVSDQTA